MSERREKTTVIHERISDDGERKEWETVGYDPVVISLGQSGTYAIVLQDITSFLTSGPDVYVVPLDRVLAVYSEYVEVSEGDDD